MDNLKRKHAIYECLSYLPEKMILLHGVKSLPEFLLHELAGESVFNLDKAAYFVDNPDFDTFKGIAGYNKSERCTDCPNIWNQPDLFIDYMSKTNFNNKVRDISGNSIKRSGKNEKDFVSEVADRLEMANPHVYTWNMKHDNHGILLVEHTEMNKDLDLHDDIRRGACFLGLCPIK